jgi:rod shape-determining protein MreD
MIMPAGQPLLLPANPRFIALSLGLALLCHMLLNLAGQDWMPDVLLITVVFWSVHQPMRVGIITAFVMGLVVDVHEGALLGQNALAYVCGCYFAITIHRRVLWFSLGEQIWQMLPLFFVTALLEWLTRLAVDDGWPQWPLLISPLLQAALWPLMSHLLLAPQRRPVDRDDIRPL